MRLPRPRVRRRDRIAELERRVDELDRSWRRAQQSLKDVNRDVKAVLRLLALSQDEAPYPQRLTSRRFSLLSDGEEDGLTLALLTEAGQTTRRFVEIGSGPNGGNSGFLALELGWSGLMVDADARQLAKLERRVDPDRVRVVQAFVERESVNELLRSNGIDGDLDVLSIDIDGNDYWIWEAIHAVSPRIAIVEFNSTFGPERAVVVPYDAHFNRHDFEGLRGLYFGASLTALTLLSRRRGYRLVAVEPRGTSAYFLRDDVAPHVQTIEPRAAFRMVEKYARAIDGDWEAHLRRIEERRLPLLDVG